MIIRDILAELSSGKSTSDLAKEIDGISKNRLTEGLNSAGYRYSRKAPVGWSYKGEIGEEPLNKSIFDYVEKSSFSKEVKEKSPSRIVSVNGGIQEGESSMKQGSQAIHEEFTQEEKLNQEGSQPFSSDEVAAMRALLAEWTKNKAKTTKLERLHERIKGLDASDKQRRTIVIDRKVGAAFDEFCKVERFNKSDIIELAIMDFIEKYSE